MNVLEKIKQMQKERHWSTYKLAYEAELTQSTLSNMYARNTVPTIETLEKICKAFEITISEFFNENKNNIVLTNKEVTFLNKYRLLNQKEKDIVEAIVTSMSNYK